MTRPHIELGGGAEFDVVRRLLEIWGDQACGIGDDAALVEIPHGEQLVVSVDAAVENIHFRREWFTLEDIGYRSTMAALSDLAAMAATPRGMLLSLVLPVGSEGDVDAIARGVGAAAARAQCPILGGNLSRGFELSLSTTVLGSATNPLRRSGARRGDALYVTGFLGAPNQALNELKAGRLPSPDAMARFARPCARIDEARWLLDAGATACVDISDGLQADCSHIESASGVSCLIDLSAIPCSEGISPAEALTSGEEYELLVTMPGGTEPDVAGFQRLFGIPLTRIGVVDAPAAVIHRVSSGWDHFG